jgi:hypothetical protein
MADDLKQTGARDGGFTSKPRAVFALASLGCLWPTGLTRVVDVLLEANKPIGES